MNKQGRIVDGKVVGGIEWLITRQPDGTETQGYTTNAVGGCFHRCRWKMQDGKIAICYAESVATKLAQHAYPHGFEYDYWHPAQLAEPARIKTPSRIFIDSMSDLFGAWVDETKIRAVLKMVRESPWHTFLSLTKNAPRLLKFVAEFPVNLHVGVSSPPDFFKSKELLPAQQEKWLHTSLAILAKIRALRSDIPELVTWMSFEPLSWDMAPIVAEHPSALRWAVIGAASNGNVYHQPHMAHVRHLHRVLDDQCCPAFHKGNLRWEPHREEYPKSLTETSHDALG